MKNIIRVILIVVFCVGTASSVQSDTITLGADEWCPYNCDPGSDLPGFMVEIAATIFKAKGHTVDYRVMPWTRAIQDARTGKYNGIIGAGKEDAPDFVFPAEEAALMKNALFGKSGMTWRYTGIDSLNEKTLGVVKGYTYTEEIDSYIKANEKKSQRIQVASGETALDSNVKKLISGRIDVIIEDANVMGHYLKKNALENEVQEVGEMPTDKLFIAFSPSNPLSQNYAGMISEGLVQLRNSGELKRILEKYGLKDWK